jgi:5-methylcytosine-specific restriction protein B
MDLPELKNTSYRLFVLPILRVLTQIGSAAPPQEIEIGIRKLAHGALSDLQWARVIKGKYVRWAGKEMKSAGLLQGTGPWEMTDIGRAYLAAHQDDPVEWPKVTPLAREDAGNMQASLETVSVTDQAAYEIPALRVLAEGPRLKKDLVPRIESDLHDLMLPGDRRILPSGDLVCRYRASWTLTNLKKAGEVRNPSFGSWEITDAGRARLERDEKNWTITSYQDSKAKVRAAWTEDGMAKPSEPPPPPPVNWPTAAWEALEDQFDGSLLTAFSDRVRPDLGCTPDLDRPLPRNVIFYGPPGTGKTFIARAIAEAMTGRNEPNADGPWTIVQFHPSYSYEDFVQGLRPALEEVELRYNVRKGPFMQICAAADKDPDTFFVLVIDEINRGDPARIFGELLYALEYRGDAVDLPLGGQLKVPANLIVIGTMNSVDRSVALVDYALRRRFAFVRVDPDPDAILNAQLADPEGAAVAAEVLEKFNAWLVKRIDREHALGHSFFLNPAITKLDATALERVWRSDVQPLLEEYFFGQADALKEARIVWAAAVKTALEDEADVLSPTTDT